MSPSASVQGSNTPGTGPSPSPEPAGGGIMTTNMSTMVFEAGNQAKSVKRPRPVKSCTSCRARKLKCDRLCPCAQCQKSHRVCKYASSDQDAGNLSDGASDLDPVERPAKRIIGSQPGPPLSPHAAAHGQHQQQRLHYPNRQRQTPSRGTPLAGTPGWAFNGTDLHGTPGGTTPLSMDEVSSRLERLERLVLAQHSSPVLDWSRSRSYYARANAMSASTVYGLTVKGKLGSRTRYFGQNATRVLLNLFDDARDFMNNKYKTGGVRELLISLQNIYTTLQEEHRKALAPISVFVDSIMPVQKRMVDILPEKPVCDRLLEAYIVLSEGLYRVIHVPTFRAEYESYWERGQCSEGFLPRLLCIILIGSRFDSESKGVGHNRADAVHVPTACALVRSWLDSLKGKQLVDLDTLQAEVLLLHGRRMITTQNQESWAQLGFIIRMAMTMGLHRDPSEFAQLPPFVGEQRRRLWFTIMEMDLHMSIATSFPSCVREFEYTCRPPRNLNDEEIYPDMKELPPGKPLDHVTHMQIQAFSASTLPCRMKAVSLLSRLDQIHDYGEVIEVGSRLERILDNIHHLFPRSQTLDPRGKYKAWRERALLDMHIRRPLIALYRPFALSTADSPAQISASYLKSNMAMLTYMDELDPHMPGFADVNYMYHVILRQDITQAAFSVCHFIRTAYESSPATPQPTTAGAGWTAANSSNSPTPSERAGSSSGYNTGLWSPAIMSDIIEKRLQALTASAKDSTADLKDTIALAIVLASVQPGGTPEQRTEMKKEGLRKILNACLQSMGATADKFSPSSLLLSSQGHRPSVSDLYAHPGQSLVQNEVMDQELELSLWDLSFWSPTPVE